MQRMWRQMFAAVLGVAALVGAAAAQSPPPQPLPPIIAVAAPVAVPASNPTVAIPQLMPAGGRLQSAAPAVTGNALGTATAPAAPAYPTGVAGCNNGCGSFKQDCAFMFGSCKSFFNPCHPNHADCGGGCGTSRFHGKCGGLFGDRCPSLPWGTPYGTGHSGCKYDSWLNH